LGIISEQVFESILFLDKVVKKAKKEGKKLKVKFVRYGPLSEKRE